MFQAKTYRKLLGEDHRNQTLKDLYYVFFGPAAPVCFGGCLRELIDVMRRAVEPLKQAKQSGVQNLKKIGGVIHSF